MQPLVWSPVLCLIKPGDQDIETYWGICASTKRRRFEITPRKRPVLADTKRDSGEPGLLELGSCVQTAKIEDKTFLTFVFSCDGVAAGRILVLAHAGQVLYHGAAFLVFVVVVFNAWCLRHTGCGICYNIPRKQIPSVTITLARVIHLISR